jgi:AcrR family transcriptional regulator
MFGVETGPDQSIPEPPWRARRRTRAARTPLTREAIVDAALRVVDKEGADALSMRRVAEELGTGPASLYWHVASKDELINLVVDRVVGEIEPPRTDPARWQEEFREWMLRAREVFRRHPGVGALTLGRIPVGPNMIRVAESTLALLRGAGIPDRIAAYAPDFLAQYLGASLYEEGLGFPSPTGEDLPPEQIVAMIRGYFASMPADRFPNLHATLDEIFSGGADERFELGLEIIIRGFASYIQR